MTDEAAHGGCLVALGEDAGAHDLRLSPGRPARGLAAVHSEGSNMRLTVFVENLRPLSDPKPPGCFFYEAWLLCGQGQPALTAGAFNTDATGQGRVQFTFDAADIRLSGHGWEQVSAICVTAEPFDGDPAPARVVLRGSVRTLAQEQPQQQRPQWYPAAGAQTVWQPAWQTAYPPSTWGVGAAPLPEGAEATPEQAAPAPPEASAPAAVAISLRAELPACAGASAAALIDRAEGNASITLRGMPPPAAFGCDPATGQPYNTYKVWLTHSHTREVTLLGFCRKVWHDTYRLQESAGPAVHRFDTVVITAEDRNGPGAPRGPRVLSAALPVD